MWFTQSNALERQPLLQQIDRNNTNEYEHISTNKTKYVRYISIGTLLTLTIVLITSYYHTTYTTHTNTHEMTLHAVSKTRDEHRFQVVKQGFILAEGIYYPNLDNNGWNHLQVQSNTNYYDLTNPLVFKDYFATIEAMGFLEGYVTCTEINQFYINFYSGLFDGGDPMPESITFLYQNYDWMISMVEENWRISNYWLSIKILLIQLEGMLKGIQKGKLITYTYTYNMM